MFSLSVMDTLYEMLFPSRDQSMSLTKYSGSRLMSNDTSFFHHIPFEYDAPVFDGVKTGLEYSEHKSTLDTNMFICNFYRVTDRNVTSEIPKLTFSRPILTFVKDCFRVLSDRHHMALDSGNDFSQSLRAFFKLPVTESCPQKASDIEEKFTNQKQSNKSLTCSSVSPLKISMEIAQVNLNSGVLVAESRMTGKLNKANNNLAMNQELVNRKAKELHKRSKKRRRRQKKVSQVECQLLPSPKLETVKENDCVESSLNRSRVTDSKNCKDNRNVLPGASSFLISVENITDEDSDLDTNNYCDWLSEAAEFQLSGLFVSNLSATGSQKSGRVRSCSFDSFNAEDLEEYSKLKSTLCEINKSWNITTKAVDQKPKSPAKVSFAPAHALVQVHPVEICERKGEWEMYAHERLRFKRRIDNLDEILSPCLTQDHRNRVFLRLHQSEL